MLSNPCKNFLPYDRLRFPLWNKIHDSVTSLVKYRLTNRKLDFFPTHSSLEKTVKQKNCPRVLAIMGSFYDV